MSINFTGLSSGMDTDAIISKLMSMERQPLIKLQQKNSLFNARKIALQDINSKLLSFYNTSRALVSSVEQTWSQKAVSVSDSTKLGVTATSDADSASYSIDILKLAQSHTVAGTKQSSSSSALYVSGKIFINGKEIQINSSDSLTNIKNKINSTEGINATAAILDNTLRIKSSSSGLSELVLADEFADPVKILSGTDVTIVSGAITGDPVHGTYDFEVNWLAEKHEVSSDAVIDPAAALNMVGTAVINGQTVNIVATDSLNDIKDKINAAGAGISAYVDASNMLRMQSQTWGASGEIVSADSSGTVLRDLGILNPDNVTYKNVVAQARDADFAMNGSSYTRSTNVFSDLVAGLDISLNAAGQASLSVTAEGGVLRSLGVLNNDGTIKNQLLAAQNAEIVIDGQFIERSSNVINDIAPGLTLTLKAVTSEPVSVTVSQNNDFIKGKITDWVNAYNTLYKLIGDRLTEATVAEPKTDSDRNKGLLRNDSQLSRVRRDIRSLIGSPVTSQPGSTEFLSQIGITTGKNGQLTIDDAKLTSALEANPDKVQSLFSAGADVAYNESTAGLAVRVEKQLKSLTNALTGEFAIRQQTIDTQIKQLAESITRWETRLASIEANLQKRFSEMERAMAAMKSQSNWLAAQLSSGSQQQ